ncbi:LuxR C-terminal-related transcriptional regulator [Limimaricola pyoseonensis]|nr:LuxR C-terminal-related transcriptional regulator [Limimaricola pyoseonensis]
MAARRLAQHRAQERHGFPASDPLTVIDRIYEVAMDPTRFEEMLDHWEAVMGPLRRAGTGLGQFDGHVQRADQVLERALAGEGADTPEAMLGRLGHAAAFAVTPRLTVSHCNPAATRAFGITPDARIGDLALAEADTVSLSRCVEQLMAGPAGDPVVLRNRARHSDRLIMFHLRLIRPRDGEAYVLAVTSELGWPEGFSALLREAFGLTHAESQILRGLAEGLSLPEIADGRGRSLATVRAQLKAILSKTETRSQTELVRLTLSSMEMAQPGLAKRPAERDPVAQPFQTLKLPDGRRLDYLILGDPAGRDCLYLPLNLGLVLWPAPAEAEARRRGLRIIVPVRAGYGHSTVLPAGVPYLDTLCDDLVRLLDHLGCGPLPVLSIGDDSLLAMAFNARHPGRMTALIACAGVLPLHRPEQYERMHKWHRFILASARYTPQLLPFMVKAGFAMVRRLGKPGFVQAVYGRSAADIRTFEIPEVREAMLLGSEVTVNDHHAAQDAFAREIVAHESHDWEPALAALRRVPVQMLNGLQDPQVPIATLEEFRDDHPWIDWRIFPDAGQLLFFLKWRDVLPELEKHARAIKS